VGEAATLVEEAPVVFNIDHHPDNSGFGDFVYVDPEAAAVGEIVYQLLPHLGAELNRELAEALYLALLTDSGSFRYQNTRPLTHHIAAELLESGVEPGRVSQEVYDNRPESALRVLAAALQSLHIHDSLPVAWIVLTQDQLSEVGARPEDTESVVDYARSLKGIEVAFLVREEENGKVKVSLRSQNFVDVSQIAATLGGGGHVRAAGCRLTGLSAHKAAEVMLGAIEQQLEHNRGRNRQS
jgi:phosphoesterase RecJ-like protein